MQKKPAFRKKKKQMAPLIICVLLIFSFCGYMGFKAKKMKETRDQLQNEVTELEVKIQDENNRTEELEEFEVYTHTKMYAEEVAKNILGYVYDDEIVFKPEE